MIEGPFGAGLLLPLRDGLLLLALLGTGLWAEAAAGSARMRILGGGLLGLALGLVAVDLGIAVPLPGWTPAVAAIALGLLAAAGLAPPALFGALVALVALFVHGYAGVGRMGLSLVGWAGFAAGTLLMMSAGLGLGTMARQGVSHRAGRVLGLGVAAAAALFLVGVLP